MGSTTTKETSHVSETVCAMAWSDLYKQHSVRQILENAAKDPVHAYLFLGAAGSGMNQAATGFASLLLAPSLPQEDQERAVAQVKSLTHPDIVRIEAEGSSLRVAEAQQAIAAASRSPFESARKVIVISKIETLEQNAVGKLLKVIEEPPQSTVFVLLGAELPPELITIASRCVSVSFAPYTSEEIKQALLDENVEDVQAENAALAAGGSIDRARLLAKDDGLLARLGVWQTIPEKLDGSGARVFEVVKTIQEGVTSALTPLEAQQAEELQELEAHEKEFGARGSGRSDLVARHKREQRSLRQDELTFGLATLSRWYRDSLVENYQETTVTKLTHIQQFSQELVRNPNEVLQLQNLLLKLSA